MNYRIYTDDHFGSLIVEYEGYRFFLDFLLMMKKDPKNIWSVKELEMREVIQKVLDILKEKNPELLL